MKKKETIRSLWTPTAGMLTGARRAAMLLLTTLLLTMTAQTAWAQTYTVSFNKCEGEGGNDYVTATLSEQMPDISVPTRDGYTFGGYFTDRGGEGTQYYDADGKSTHVWDKEVDATLYAMWTTDRINISVFFTWENYGSNLADDVLEGYEKSGLSVKVNGQSVSREINYYPAVSQTGQKNTISVSLPSSIYALNATYSYIDPEENFQDGVQMTYEGSEYKWSFTIADNDISSQERDVTIRINIGDAETKYIVFFDANGGTGDAMEYLIMDPSSTKNLPACTFLREDYTFKGWATSASGSRQYDDGAEITAGNTGGTLTLYAKWFNNSAQMNTYTVTLNQQEGSGGTESVTATYGADMPAITLPTKTGYTFGGYFTEPNGNGTQYYNADGSSACTWNIADNTTLYAHWKKCLSNTEITIEIPAQTYSGSQLTPVVTVKDNGSVVSDAHYTISLPEGRTNAGDYIIEIEAKEGSTAYAGSKTATFTINQKDLTVTANDHTISYGDAPANDGVTYSGFVNNENESVLEGELTYTYSNEKGEYGTDNDVPGEYEITPGGLTSDNYAITFVPGKLTVNPFTVPLFAANSSNLWMTWCDKYDYEKPEGVTVYTVSGVENNTVTLAEVSGDVIPAYTPVLLYREAAGNDAVTATFSAVGTAPASGYDSSSGIVEANLSNNVTLYGNSGDEAYASGSDNKIFAVSESSAIQSYVLLDGQFVLVDHDEGISAHRCWLNVTKSTTNGARLLSINTDSESTGIETTNFTNSANPSGAWYGIDGRKLDGKPTKKGLYIYNGKKQVIK